MREIALLTVRRLAFTVPVILGISLYVFLILQFSPADPRFATLGIYASPEQREQFAREYHLDDPVYVRYPRFVSDLVRGDLGISVYGQTPVTEVLADKVPVTVALALLALGGALLVAFILGVTSAYFAGSWWDSAVRAFSFGGLAMPVFWLGLLLIQLVALKLRLLPAGGYVPFADDPGGWARSMALPALTLALPVSGFLTRVVRSSVLDELDRDYVRTARGGGVPDYEVVWRNVLRNALVSPLTVIGLQAGYLLSGAVLVEVVFNLPGMGLLLLQSAQQGDMGVIVGVALVSALAFVLVNLVVDIAYLAVNPRARQS
jgi:peptide/nickel transport system permease protein